jgi:hypothetical protein
MTVMLICHKLKVPLFVIFLEIFVCNTIAITIAEIVVTFTSGREMYEEQCIEGRIETIKGTKEM